MRMIAGGWRRLRVFGCRRAGLDGGISTRYSLHATHYFSSMADPKILQTFPNPAPHRDFVIEHTHHEFTSVCPMTGHPDFANITVRYVADKTCVELKSLKLYLQRFRDRGIFYEQVTNQLLDDFVAACKPVRCKVVSVWTPRGGITTTVTCSYEAGK